MKRNVGCCNVEILDGLASNTVMSIVSVRGWLVRPRRPRPPVGP